MYSTNSQSLVEQKRLQWAKEREEMMGLSGLWGNLDKTCQRRLPSADRSEPRRNSLLPPIQPKSEELKDKAEESETSGYLSDSPQHDSESSAESRSSRWSAKRENYWGEQKAQKNLRNECRLRGTPDSLLSTPEVRMKWGDRGVGVGHLWEPMVELPDSRLPQVYEAYRATPRWVERSLTLSEDNSKADILVIQHDEEERSHSNFLLGQNVPVPPDILEERERKRRKALEHQNAIIKQLEEREKKRKEERENKLREERLEEERLAKEREREQLRQEEEMKKLKEKEMIERRKEEAMKEALEAAEKKAKEEKHKVKKKEVLQGMKKSVSDHEVKQLKREKRKASLPPTPREEPEMPCKEEEEEVMLEVMKETQDSACQAEEPICKLSDSSCQSESMPGLQFLNEGGGLALVLDGGPQGGLLVPQDAVQLLLMSPGQPAPPVQRAERVLTPSKLRGMKSLSDATTQTDGKCCQNSMNSLRSRRCVRLSGRTSGRSDSSEKSTSLERIHSHSHCMSSYKQRSRSQPRLPMNDRPKWGINRPTVQYMKQSEKDPHYLRRLKRRARRIKESVSDEKLLQSECRLLPFQTDDEMERKLQEDESTKERLLKNGFRMVSNPSSPKFVPIARRNVDNEYFEVMAVEVNGVDDVDLESKDESPLSTFRDSENVDERSEQVEEVEEISRDNVSQAEISTPENETSSGIESLENVGSPPDTIGEMSSGPITDRSDSPLLEISKEENEECTDNCSSSIETSPGHANEAPQTVEELEEKLEVLSFENEGDIEGENEPIKEQEKVEDEDDDDEDNAVVVIPRMKPRLSDTLNQISALKLGLERLQREAESGCSTPCSPGPHDL